MTRDVFTAMCTPTDAGCIEWQGTINKDGYGVFKVSGRSVFAHRWIYEEAVGPIPDGLTIDHLCRNRRCVHVSHLEPVTQAENARRAQAAKTHCRWGHEFTPENTRYARQRTCRPCEARRQREYQARKKAQDPT